MILYYPTFAISPVFIIPVILFFVLLHEYRTLGGMIRLIYMLIWGTVLLLLISCDIAFSLLPILTFELGEYETVEGEVQDFIPNRESFTINGVKFEYSASDNGSQYKKAYDMGGVIRDNGQYLRINYTEDGGKNEILCIQSAAFVDRPEKSVNMLQEFFIILFPLAGIIGVELIFVYGKRKRLAVLYDKSFIRRVEVKDDKAVVHSVIIINNTYKNPKNVKISGYFSDKNIFSKQCRLTARNANTSLESFELCVGLNRLEAFFTAESEKLTANTADGNINFMLPKLKISFIGNKKGK